MSGKTVDGLMGLVEAFGQSCRLSGIKDARGQDRGEVNGAIFNDAEAIRTYAEALAVPQAESAQPVELSIETRMGERAPEYQLRLTVGVQSFTICQPRETLAEATWLMQQFGKALDVAAPVAVAPLTDDAMDAAAVNGLAWALSRWKDEVSLRPLVNIHRRTLDDVWRQVIRYFGGDPAKLLGPAHDDLLIAAKDKS